MKYTSEQLLSRKCENCGKPILLERKKRGVRIDPAAIMEARYCGRYCMNEHNGLTPELKDKTCKVCDKNIMDERISRGRAVSPSILERAKYCGTECRANSRSVDYLRKKKCENCGGSIYEIRLSKGRRPSPSDIENARFCTKKCRYDAEKAVKESEKFCLNCGIELKRRAGESTKKFAGRKCCSQECSIEYEKGHSYEHKDGKRIRRIPKIERPKIDDPVSRFIYGAPIPG